MRYPIFDQEPWNSQKLRIMPVDNYLVFYIADEASMRITVIRIMYKGRDLSLILTK